MSADGPVIRTLIAEFDCSAPPAEWVDVDPTRAGALGGSPVSVVIWRQIAGAWTQESPDRIEDGSIEVDCDGADIGHVAYSYTE